MLKDDEICPTKLEMQNKDNSDDCISRSSNIFGYRTLRSMEPDQQRKTKEDHNDQGLKRIHL